MKYIKRIILLIAVVFATTLQAQTKTFNSQVRVKQVPLSSSLDSLVTINSDGLLTYLPKSELANGGALEFITEAGNTGIAIKGRNPDNYGDIGEGAVDLSFSNVSSTTLGAVGDYSLVSGNLNTGGRGSLVSGYLNSGGIYSVAGGQFNVVGNIASGFGSGNFAPSYAETSIGLYGTDYTPNNVNGYNASDRVFNIGNGTDENNRSDALTVYKSGNAILDGDLTVDNIIGNGSQLTNVDASTLNGLSEGSFVGKSTNVNSTSGVVTSASDNTIAFAVNGGGSTGFPTEFGSTVHFNLADMERDFSLFKVKGGDRYYLRDYNNNNTSNEWRELYHSGNSAPTRTINTSTLQTSSTLNSDFPFADNPDGTIVVNKDAVQSFMYIRVSSTQWKAVSLGSTI